MLSDPGFYVVGAILVLVFTYLGYETRRVRRNEQRIRQTGRPARASVVSASQTGTWIANNPVLALSLRVSEDGQPERVLKTEKLIPVTASALFTPGAVFQLLIDPTNPREFVFDEPWAAQDEDA